MPIFSIYVLYENVENNKKKYFAVIWVMTHSLIKQYKKQPLFLQQLSIFSPELSRFTRE